MKARFFISLTAGSLGLALTLIFGSAGSAAMAIFAITAFLKKKKYDEREYQLFYKANTLAFVITMLSMSLVYFLSDFSINNHRIGDNWYLLTWASFLFANGLSGLIVFKKDE